MGLGKTLDKSHNLPGIGEQGNGFFFVCIVFSPPVCGMIVHRMCMTENIMSCDHWTQRLNGPSCSGESYVDSDVGTWLW